MSEQDAPRPALDAATVERLREAVAHLGPLRYLDGGDRFDRAEATILNHAGQLVAAAAERDALAGECARYKAALESLARYGHELMPKYQSKSQMGDDARRALGWPTWAEAVGAWASERAALAPAAGAREGAGDGE